MVELKAIKEMMKSKNSWLIFITNIILVAIIIHLIVNKLQ